LTLAAPTLKKRAGPTDADILNYALTLEHLEATFYAQALQNYTQDQFASAGYGGMFYQMVQTLAYDEKTHVDFLTSALTGKHILNDDWYQHADTSKAAGAKPVAACCYNFGVTNVHQFAALASVLEGVGVSAYLGAAQYIQNKDYLTAAASILTVEARHNAYIRNKIGELPFPNPFDTPLDLDE
jgi:rubrerythrin